MSKLFYFICLLLIILFYSFFQLFALSSNLFNIKSELNHKCYISLKIGYGSRLFILQELINKYYIIRSIEFKNKAYCKLVNQIWTFSTMFKNYDDGIFKYDGWDFCNLERKLFLLSILRCEFESASFRRINKNMNFSNLDLRYINLDGFNMSGMNFRNVDFQYSSFIYTDLSNAILNRAKMQNTNLDNASLVGANLIAAKLNKAKLYEVNFQGASLDSADLSSALVIKANLANTSLIHTKFIGANMFESDLRNSLLMSANLSKANLSRGIIFNSDIYFTDFCIVTLNDAIVCRDWKNRLYEKENTGLFCLFDKYQIVADSLFIRDSIVYRLKSHL